VKRVVCFTQQWFQWGTLLLCMHFKERGAAEQMLPAAVKSLWNEFSSGSLLSYVCLYGKKSCWLPFRHLFSSESSSICTCWLTHKTRQIVALFRMGQTESGLSNKKNNQLLIQSFHQNNKSKTNMNVGVTYIYSYAGLGLMKHWNIAQRLPTPWLWDE